MELTPLGTAYRDARLRITELVRADLDAGERVVPACPRWTVQQLVSHLTGVVADALAGNLDGVATDPWTQAQVDARAGRPVGEVLDEWDELSVTFEPVIGDGFEQLLFDTATHEHDLRNALGAPGARDSAATAIGLHFGLGGWRRAHPMSGAPPLRIVAGDESVEAGDDPDVTLALEPFEAMRACSGRRSLRQLAAYDWGTDPEPWLPSFTFGPFTPQSDDLVE